MACGHVAVNVCETLASNPCTVGSCLNDNQGSYHCQCPQGFVDWREGTKSICSERSYLCTPPRLMSCMGAGTQVPALCQEASSLLRQTKPGCFFPEALSAPSLPKGALLAMGGMKEPRDSQTLLPLLETLFSFGPILWRNTRFRFSVVPLNRVWTPRGCGKFSPHRLRRCWPHSPHRPSQHLLSPLQCLLHGKQQQAGLETPQICGLA